MNPHDPLCPEFDDYPLNGYQCCCEEITTARADERKKIMIYIEEAKVISNEMMLAGRSLSGQGFASLLEEMIKRDGDIYE